MNGEISWEDYLFKRNVGQVPGKRVYSNIIRIRANNDTDDSDNTGVNNTVGAYRRLTLKPARQGTPLSSYLIFGKTPDAPKLWSNPQMEKLGSSVCEHNPLTKFAHANSKLLLLTYVEAEMDGCRKRASDKWIRMMKHRMNASEFQPPCKGTQCCKIADMVNEKMVCDGGGVAVPSCDNRTCTWKYDCTNATLDEEEDDKNKTVTVATPRSVYRKYAANADDNVAFAEGSADGTNTNGAEGGITPVTKMAIGGGIAGGLVVVVIIVIVVLKIKESGKKGSEHA